VAADWLASKTYTLALLVVLASVFWLQRLLFAPFGYALRAGRDSMRADAWA
jgi:branched-chain amino acid transport system permease protein